MRGHKNPHTGKHGNPPEFGRFYKHSQSSPAILEEPKATDQIQSLKDPSIANLSNTKA